MEAGERDQHERQEDDMEDVRSQQRGSEGGSKERLRDRSTEKGNRLEHGVDDRERRLCRLIPRQNAAGDRERNHPEQQHNANDPVRTAPGLICAMNEHHDHVEERRDDEQVCGPPVETPQKQRICSLNGGVGVRVLERGPVPEAQEQSRDHQHNEQADADATQAECVGEPYFIRPDSRRVDQGGVLLLRHLSPPIA